MNSFSQAAVGADRQEAVRSPVAAARPNVDPARFALTMMPWGCCCLIGVGLPVGLSCGLVFGKDPLADPVEAPTTCHDRRK
jgi:hypothetical protein